MKGMNNLTAKWFMQRDSSNLGPYTWEELRQFVQEGRLHTEGLVKSEQMENWVLASAVPGLIETVDSAPPPPNAYPQQLSPSTSTRKKEGSLLKTLIIVIGSVVGLAVIGFIILVAIELVSPGDQPREEATEVIPENSAEQTPEVMPGMKLFAEPGYGFTVNYPQDWIFEKDLEKIAVIFSGPEGTDEYYTTVTFQTVFSRDLGGYYDSLEELYTDLKSQHEEVGGKIHSYEEQTFEYHGATYPMINYDTTFQMNGEDVWRYVIILERDQHAFHQISYTAPIDLIDLSLEEYELILDTFDLTDF